MALFYFSRSGRRTVILFTPNYSFLIFASYDLQSVFFPNFLHSSPKLEYGYLYGGIEEEEEEEEEELFRGPFSGG